jgi:aryl-alcohol dehydrogenase-like predicted oxidoreductase
LQDLNSPAATIGAQFSAALPVEALQPPYHLFCRDIETAVLPYAAAHNIGVLVQDHSPMGC